MARFGRRETRFRRDWRSMLRGFRMRARLRSPAGMIGAAVWCAMIALAPAPTPAQDATFHVDVKLVNIFVNVTDKNGAIVGELTKDDFAVFEDNRLQQIALFERK